MGLAFGDYIAIDETGREMAAKSREFMHWRLRHNLQGGPIRESMDFTVRGGVMVVMGALVRRASLDPDWLTAPVGGAYDFWLTVKLAETGAGLFYVPRSVMRYRLHSSSESARTSPERAAGEVYIYEYLVGAPLSEPLREFVTRKLADRLYRLGHDRLLFGGNSKCARRAIKRSLSLIVRPKVLLAWMTSWLPGKVRLCLLGWWYRFRCPATLARMRAHDGLTAALTGNPKFTPAADLRHDLSTSKPNRNA